MDADTARMRRHHARMHRMHLRMLWAHWLNAGLGLWLALSPFVFGSFSSHQFTDTVMQVTADRQLANPADRLFWLGCSDLATGLAIALFALMSLSERLKFAPWANAVLGTWLLFAPLVFWSPTAAVYGNDTLVGALVIAFAILVPMMPGMSHAAMIDRSTRPPGWSYSPSSWPQRLPIIVLGFCGLLIARWLTAYQLGHTDHVWEPFFAGTGGDNGTETIITSDVSKAWPIPDAGLGAVSYVFEVLMGAMGDARRWRTMPWMVAGFGIVVVPLGVVSIWFIVIQPISIGTWCTLCLATALLMLLMMPLALDELVAMGQFLLRSHRRGAPFWRTFLRGAAEPEADRDPQLGFDRPAGRSLVLGLRGATLPWSLALVCVLGVALMTTRLLFGHAPPLANSDHLVGALVLTTSVLALAEVARALRWLNLLFGAWLCLAPWLLDGGGGGAWLSEALFGLAIIALSLRRGSAGGERYGGFERWII